MQTESSWKYYYRYKVRSLSDLPRPVIQRRLKKALKNNATHLFVDWTECEFNLYEQNNHFLNGLFTGSIEHFLTVPQLRDSLAKKVLLSKDTHIQIRNSGDIITLDRFLADLQLETKIHGQLSPLTTTDLQSFNEFLALNYPNYGSFFWNFRSYNQDLYGSLTTKDIGRFFRRHPHPAVLKNFKEGCLTGLEIWNDQIPEHFELEADTSEEWSFSTPGAEIQLSFIIPTFNNVKFLSNVLTHLIQQTLPAEKFEIIVVDDGGADQSSETIRLLFENYKKRINLKYIYWSKDHPNRGSQDFFRAGLARNLGVHCSAGENILFLDSDILVPPDFAAQALSELQNNSVIQFQRYHIHQDLSLKNPSYSEIRKHSDTYIEEQEYWNQLFESRQWSDLPQYWKFTCTYALGLKKETFFKCGRFKKYYVSYGFEDTDLGYELHRRHCEFKLIKMPLFHLTAYDKLQYKNSQTKRYRLLKKTAALFYRQHLDPEIFDTLAGYFHFEKPFKRFLLDLF